MSAVRTDELRTLLDETLMLFSETVEYHRGHERVQAVLEEARQTLIGLRQRLRLDRSRYVVGVVGLTNVGKSTLLNALLGDDVAPRRNRPCTAAPVEFVHGDALRVIVHHHQSLHRPTYRCSNVEAVHHHLARLVDGSDGDASRNIRRVVVEAPLPLLEDGLVISDTPGFGAVQQAEAAGTHEAALKQYLQTEVTQVFWVVLADQGIGRREMEFHDRLLADVCDDVLVTGCEDWEEHERQRWRRRFIDAFSGRLPAFHFVSGLAGVEARRRGDERALEEAGITELEKRIRELAEPEGRHWAAQQQLRQLAEDLAYWLDQYRDERGWPLKPWLRPDSWARWSRNVPDTTLKQTMTSRLERSS